MKTRNIILSVAGALTLFSCGGNTEQTKAETKEKCNFSVIADSTKVNWAGYKFTAKTPVKGTFKEATLTKFNTDKCCLHDALKGNEFSIPTASVFSGNDIRDPKLKDILFGSMDSTSHITGKIVSAEGTEEKGSVLVDVKLNNMVQSVKMNYRYSFNKIELKGNIDLINWKAEKAVEALHKACETLHTGEDGVSKTWSEVAITVTTQINKECK